MKTTAAVFRNIIFNLIIIVLCFTSSIIAMIGDNLIYNTLWILPLAYLLVYLLSLKIFEDKVFGNIGYVLFWGQSIIKCVIAPMLLCIGNYTSLFPELKANYVFISILLLIYEQVACTFVIALVSSRTKKKPIKMLKSNATIYPKLKMDTFVAIFMGCLVVMWIIAPTIQNSYTNIFSMIFSNKMFEGNDYTSIGGLGRICTTLFLVVFKSFRIIFPFYCIKVLKEKYNNVISFIASLSIIIASQFLFISETVAMSIIVTVILLIYLLCIYPKYTKIVLGVIAGSSVFVLIVLLISFNTISQWYEINSITEYMSLMLQSYMPGVCNTASIFRAEQISGFSTLLDTLISTIPFQNTLLGTSLWENDLNSIFESIGLGTQIVSTIAGGWYIFGVIGAPLFSMLFTYVSISSGYKYQESDKDLKKLLYLYLCVQSILGVGMYNIQTTITLWIQVDLVLWVMTKIVKE